MSQQDVTWVLQSFKFQISTVTAEGSKRQICLIPKMSGNNLSVRNLPDVLKIVCHTTKSTTQVSAMFLKRINDISTAQSK